MTGPIYSTSAEAINAYVAPALAPYADEYDLHTIFAECFTYDVHRRGFRCVASGEEFWESVQRNHFAGEPRHA